MLAPLAILVFMESRRVRPPLVVSTFMHGAAVAAPKVRIRQITAIFI